MEFLDIASLIKTFTNTQTFYMVFNKKVPLVRGVGEVLEKEQTVPSKINCLFFYNFTFSLALYIFGHTGMGGKYFKIRQ